MELKSLNSDIGIEFIFQRDTNAESALPYIRKTVERNDYSLGVFIDDQPVSRILLATTGHMGFLRTLDAHRGKGYSTICMQQLTHRLAQETKLYPCSMVDLQNKASNAVHKSAGLRLSHLVDFVIYRGNAYE